MMIECGFLNRFANDIRYPHKMETNIGDVNVAIKYAEKIKNIEPLKKLRDDIKNDPEKDVKQSNCT
ncbi:hypothetical protein FACS189450_05500 [Spirochaetia bacterium]|nr:hypothetical protein FACS189450_05500 [Spirochaetia bacterium]